MRAASVTAASSAMTCTRGPAARGEGGEAFEVVLGQRVLDGDDRVAAAPAQHHLDHRAGLEAAPVAGEAVAAALPELRRPRRRARWPCPRPAVAGALDGAQQARRARPRCRRNRPEPALVGDPGEPAASRPSRRRRRGRPRRSSPAPAGSPRRRWRHDHEVLQVDAARRHGRRRRKSGSSAGAGAAVPGPRRATARAACRGRRPRRAPRPSTSAMVALPPSRAYPAGPVEPDEQPVDPGLVGGVAGPRARGR